MSAAVQGLPGSFWRILSVRHSLISILRRLRDAVGGVQASSYLWHASPGRRRQRLFKFWGLRPGGPLEDQIRCVRLARSSETTCRWIFSVIWGQMGRERTSAAALSETGSATFRFA